MKNSMACTVIAALCLALSTGEVSSHGKGVYQIYPLEWESDYLSQVTAMGGPGKHVSVDGKKCIAADTLNFNVRDDYAFDLDETVGLDLEVQGAATGGTLSVTYDGHDLTPSGRYKQVELPAQTHQYSIPLERARFANLGPGGSDFSIASGSAICGLSLRRSYTTPLVKDFGWVEIEVVDERGRPTAARMGLYDSLGRLPLPGDEAVLLRNFAGADRIKSLPAVMPWPVKNRSVFYTDRSYHSRLPVGDYDLIVAKGPEYRLARQRFTVKSGQSRSIKIELSRWIDMASKGWYSGDGHIHYTRESAHDDRPLQLFAQAEDLRVSNILQMGNIATFYFPQGDWKPVVSERDASFVLVPGQEDQRTSYRGHTMQLNLRRPARNPSHYLLYHEVFKNVRAQGGLTGYAHVTSAYDPLFNAGVGLALDVPFGLVDFVEVLSQETTPDAVWFDFLNLGYKLSPAAGTDYMGGYMGADVIDVIGYVRNYVHVDKPFIPQAWFDALKAGRTFVTNGPMLEFELNGRGMGAELRVKRGEPLTITARASINSDMGALSKVELIEQGEIVKSADSPGGQLEIELRHGVQAAHGTWFLVRAHGEKNAALAVSAPIYVFVEGESFWKPKDVPAIVSKLKLKMQKLLAPPPTNELGGEEPETRELLVEQWRSQQGKLKARVEEANAIYDDLVKRAAAISSDRH